MANDVEALAWMRRRLPLHEACVVLLDLMMPVMDGRSFPAEKAADPHLAGVPVV